MNSSICDKHQVYFQFDMKTKNVEYINISCWKMLPTKQIKCEKVSFELLRYFKNIRYTLTIIYTYKAHPSFFRNITGMFYTFRCFPIFLFMEALKF